VKERVIFLLDILICNSIRMEDMQPQSLRLERLAIDSLPIIDDFIERIKLARLLREKIRYESISEKRFQQFAFQKKPTIKVRNVGFRSFATK
jgi:uncharacterized iron-regulated protein